MSPTTEDLRQRMAHELDQFPALEDLTAPSLSGGRRRVRRRRVAGALSASAVAAAAIVPVFLLLGPHGPPDGRTPARDDVASERATSPAVVPDPARSRAAGLRAQALADGVVTRDEWDRAVVATLDALLPTRFGGLSQISNEAVPQVRTRAGEPRMDLSIGVSGIKGSVEVQPGWGGCPEVREAAAESDFEWDILDCADARFGDGFRVRADSERLVGGSQSDTPGQTSYAGALVLLHEGLYAQLGITPVGTEAALPITSTELVELAQTEDFLDLVRVGTAYSRDARGHPDEIVESVDPVWPD